MLKPCRECGKDVSTEARTCPHCGTRWPGATAQQAARSRELWFVAIGVAVACALVWIFAQFQ